MVDCNKVSSTYNTHELMEYLRLVGTLGEITSYEDLFPILTLIALLSGDGLSSDGARFATDMRNKYFTVLVRIIPRNLDLILSKLFLRKFNLCQNSFHSSD